MALSELNLGFEEYAAAARLRVEAALAHYPAEDAACPPRLRESIRYSLLAGGKRLRPLLVLLAADACGATEQQAMPAACAVEMIHTYSLVHDDLPAMDNDDLRRGRPTNHKVYGDALAILAGDGLLTLAFEVIAREIHPARVAVRACAILAQAAGIVGMVGGQAADILGGLESQSETEGGLTESDLSTVESIHARKTGALWSAGLQLGAAVAEASVEQEQALLCYGRKLGLAFQIVDDLLDVQGDPSAVGKRVGKDSTAGKLTYPRLMGIAASRQKAEQLVAEARAALAPFGPRAFRLEALAQFVLERDR